MERQQENAPPTDPTVGHPPGHVPDLAVGDRRLPSAAGDAQGERAIDDAGAGHDTAAPRRRWWAAVLALGVALVAAGVALVAGLGGPTRLGSPRVQTEVPATAMDQVAMPSNNSPLLVADPTNSAVVVMANRIDARDFGCALQLSGDGGRTWIPAAPVPRLPDGADKCYAPEAAFDRNGTLYYLFVGLHGPGNEPMGAFLTVSDNRGRTFSPPRRVLGPLNFGVRMAIDPVMGSRGRMHLVWLAAGADPGLGGFAAVPNPIMSAYSDDGGRTFSQPVQVSDPDRARVVGPALAVGEDHRVHVAYYDLQDDARDYLGLEGPVWEGNWSVVVATSSDAGRSFAAGGVADDKVTPPERPMLIFTMAPPALVADGDRVCTAWTDARHGDADAMVRCSPDQGRNWGRLRRINDDRIANGHRQYLPRLAVAPGGRLDAVFFDRRLDPNNIRQDVFYTFSTDGGRSFVANRRVTRVRSYVKVGAQYANTSAKGQVEFGGRLGLLSTRSGALVAWPDTRHSRPGTGQDVFAASIEIPGGGRAGWSRLAGPALVLAGAVVLAAGWARRRSTRAGSADESGHHEPHQDDAPPVPASKSARRGARRVAGVGIVVVAAGAVASQRGAGPGDGRPAPAPAQVIDVTMHEYSYDYQAPAQAGRAVFRIRNAGREDHRFALYYMPENLPPIDAQLRGDSRVPVKAFADLATLKPGGVQTIATNLVKGQRYALACFVPDKEGAVHALLGMNSEFRGGGGPAGPTTTAGAGGPAAPTTVVPTTVAGG